MEKERADAPVMVEGPRRMLQYRILRYVPNLVRDEWMNIGVLLEEADGSNSAMRLVSEPAELARIRRLHGDVDQELLQDLRGDFDARLRGSWSEISAYLAKLDQTLSTTLQFSPQKGLLAEDFYSELDRLYRDHVTPPSPRAGGKLQSTLDWMREKLTDVFRRHRVLGKLEQRVRIEGFTQPGDPLRLDYGYQNGVRGFIHSISLRRDIQQAKVLAYTAQSIHARDARAQITAITEVEPAADNPRHQFVAKLFAEEQIRMVPLNRVESFAEELRLQLN